MFGALTVACALASAAPVTITAKMRPLTRELAGAEVHAYDVPINAGAFVELTVDAKGVDVRAWLRTKPDGPLVAEADAPGASARDLLRFDAKEAGVYRLELFVSPEALHDSTDTRGTYTLTFVKALDPGARERELKVDASHAPAAARWVKERAVPLTTVEPLAPLDDLAPVLPLLADKRVVAIGQGTHGTHEFQQVQHRVTRLLVERAGFTAVAIEAPFALGFDVDDYVVNGRGDLERAVAGLQYVPLETEETLALLRWLRAYNAGPGRVRKVHVYAVDTAYAARAARMFLEYVGRVDPKRALALARVVQLVGGSSPYHREAARGLTQEDRASAIAAIEAALAALDARSAPLLSGDDIARQHGRSLVQVLKFTAGNDERARDEAMADNIAWALAREGDTGKIVFLAASSHVSLEPGFVGHRLRRTLGASFVSIGTLFDAGSFQAYQAGVGMRAFSVTPIDASFDHTIASAVAGDAAFLDLRGDPPAIGTDVVDWLSRPRLMRHVGADFDPARADAYVWPTPPRARFDAVWFVRTSTPVRSLGYRTSSLQPLVGDDANLDFETSDAGVFPAGWDGLARLQAALGTAIATSADRPHGGTRALELRALPGKEYGEHYAWVRRTIDAAPYRGKKVRVRAWARVEGEGSAYLSVSTRGAADDMHERPLIAANAKKWTQVEVVLAVPADAPAVVIAPSFVRGVGAGAAWFDDVTIDAVQDATK